MNKAEIINKADKIRGWFSLKQMDVLYPIVKELPVNGLIVEIGTYCGRSAEFFSLTNPKIKILTVDNLTPTGGKDEGYNIHLPDANKIWPTVLEAGNIFQVIGSSKSVSEGFNWKMDFLFIDGGHSYYDCFNDARYWAPLLNSGCNIVFHDYQYPQVRQATHDWLEESPEFEKVDIKEDLFICRKKQ